MSDYMNWESDTDHIICPYCGAVYRPSVEDTYIGGEHVCCFDEGNERVYKCDLCRKQFKLTCNLVWNYETETLPGEMSEEDHYRDWL